MSTARRTAPSAQNRVEHAEIRVLGRGGDERDAPVLDEFQQRLLLLFVEILDLIEIQQHAAGGEHGVQLRDYLLDVGDTGGRRVELAQTAVSALGDDARDGGFPRAGGAVEYHVWYLPALDDTPQHTAGTKYMLLPDNVVKTVRAYLVCQWFIHER